MEILESTLENRLKLLEGVKSVFRELYPHEPVRIRRGDAQFEILLRLEERPHGFNRRIVSEALGDLGYEKVKIQGILYYRRKAL
jgi:hypothetical protein